MPGILQSMGSQRVMTPVTEQQQLFKRVKVKKDQERLCVGVWVPARMCTQLLSCIQLFATPWTATHQTPLPMGFSSQEYWSGLPFLLPGDLPDPGIKPESSEFLALQADPLQMLSHQESPRKIEKLFIPDLRPLKKDDK